jgi:multiple sugar transport system ATP-binding protein
MAKVKFEGVSKIFGKSVIACSEINLEIEDGEFLTLLGPSGCGKTTLLNIVAGLEKATSGKVFFGDSLVNDLPPRDRNVAMVFQSYALYPHMNIEDNLQFSLKLKKVSKGERRRQVLEIAEMLAIDQLLERKPRELSGGQRQRVALGRALVRRPDLFLLDEPLSNLDAKLRVTMRAEISRLHRRLGTTTIYVTHDQLEAMTMSDRIAVMNNGKIQQVGSPDEIYNKPANCFVAGFVGTPSMNFIDCELRHERGMIWLDFGFGKLELRPEIGTALTEQSASRELIVGVRPEDITITAPDEQKTLSGEISLVELLGANQLIHLDCRGKNLVALAGVSLTWAIGDKVGIVFSQSRLNFFDPSSERSIL